MSDTYNYALRMPIELGEFIQELAKKNRRPINETIVILLENAVKEKTRRKRTKEVPAKHQS